jgi:hypothetical protein
LGAKGFDLSILSEQAPIARAKTRVVKDSATRLVLFIGPPLLD